MSKLSSIAKAYTRDKCHDDVAESYVYNSYIDGFKASFSIIKEELVLEMKKVEQYPMMGERIFALKTYINKMNTLLEELEKDGY